MKVIYNALHCLECDNVIFSLNRHDFHSCTCENVSVDGGHDYFRISYKNETFEALRIEIEYEDRNKLAEKSIGHPGCYLFKDIEEYIMPEIIPEENSSTLEEAFQKEEEDADSIKDPTFQLVTLKNLKYPIKVTKEGLGVIAETGEFSITTFYHNLDKIKNHLKSLCETEKLGFLFMTVLLKEANSSNVPAFVEVTFPFAKGVNDGNIRKVHFYGAVDPDGEMKLVLGASVGYTEFEFINPNILHTFNMPGAVLTEEVHGLNEMSDMANCRLLIELKSGVNVTPEMLFNFIESSVVTGLSTIGHSRCGLISDSMGRLLQEVGITEYDFIVEGFNKKS